MNPEHHTRSWRHLILHKYPFRRGALQAEAVNQSFDRDERKAVNIQQGKLPGEEEEYGTNNSSRGRTETKKCYDYTWVPLDEGKSFKQGYQGVQLGLSSGKVPINDAVVVHHSACTFKRRDCAVVLHDKVPCSKG